MGRIVNVSKFQQNELILPYPPTCFYPLVAGVNHTPTLTRRVHSSGALGSEIVVLRRGKCERSNEWTVDMDSTGMEEVNDRHLRETQAKGLCRSSVGDGSSAQRSAITRDVLVYRIGPLGGAVRMQGVRYVCHRRTPPPSESGIGPVGMVPFVRGEPDTSRHEQNPPPAGVGGYRHKSDIGPASSAP